MQKRTSKYLLHWEQKGLGLGPTLHHHGLQDVQTHLFVSFLSLLYTFWETSHSTLFHCYSNGLNYKPMVTNIGFNLSNQVNNYKSTLVLTYLTTQSTNQSGK